jgi:nucleotide-binding universal stress UspA family protein
MSAAAKINAHPLCRRSGRAYAPRVRRAIHLAKVHEAKLVIPHLVEPLSSTGQAVVADYPSRRFASRCSMTAFARCRPAGRLGARPRQALDRGADMIVIGNCSHALPGRGLLGSTTIRVVQTSRVPVLVVPNCHD